MFRFETLEIWQIAIEYSNHIYDLTNAFPKEEAFGLTSQLRRAAVSIPTNIAEGSGASTVKDFNNFLDFSVKSTLETVSLLKIASLRELVDELAREELYDDAERLVRKIRAFKKSLLKRQALSNKP